MLTQKTNAARDFLAQSAGRQRHSACTTPTGRRGFTSLGASGIRRYAVGEKKASTWGGSPDDSASGEGIAISPNGTVAVAGFVHSPPYEFAGVSNSSRNADATSTDVISTAPAPAGTVNTDPGGVVTTPIGSETYAGDSEAFFLRLQR